ncbi:MAG: S8 family serine peptidase [Anaerolineae bacterium]|nr:S8 family serine peptidase [Anaerolineae bacterium]
MDCTELRIANCELRITNDVGNWKLRQITIGLLWIGWLICWLPHPVKAQAPQTCEEAHIPGVVLVAFESNVLTAARQLAYPTVAALPALDVVAVRVPAGEECTVLQTLHTDARVAYAELDYAVHVTGFITPNDPGWAQQWGPAHIGVPQVWSQITNTADIIVAVLDSGVYLGHADLQANLWRNRDEIATNGIDDDGNGKIDDIAGWHFYHAWAWDGTQYTYLPREDAGVDDDYGHGTHVAGIIGATINNGVGIAGVAGNSYGDDSHRVLPVKVLNQYGNGWYSDIALGILYAVDNGARVINISAGGSPASETLQAAVDYARARGALVIAATGNENDAVLYPAACDHVLAVAATDRADARAGFSNYGPQVDIAAPGVDIYSTWYRGNYITKSGTSMAAPHVSGVAALLWGTAPNLQAMQIGALLTSTAVQSSTQQSWNPYTGWGRVDAARAWESLRSHRQYLPVILY